MADSPRIEELKRRVEKDPASIAFAQLAEEYRRSGDLEQAVAVSRAGLAQHPAYLSARVTLGRALTDLQRFDDAQAELDYVLRAAPDNGSGVAALEELRQRRGGRATVRSQIPLPPDPAADAFEQALATLDALTLDVSTSHPGGSHPPITSSAPVIAELERWLAAILADRERRARST